MRRASPQSPFRIVQHLVFPSLVFSDGLAATLCSANCDATCPVPVCRTCGWRSYSDVVFVPGASHSFRVKDWILLPSAVHSMQLDTPLASRPGRAKQLYPLGENYLSNGRMPELNSRLTSLVFSRIKFVRPSRARCGVKRLRSIKLVVAVRTNALTSETKPRPAGERATSSLTKRRITLNNKSVSTVAMAASSAAFSFADTTGSSVPNVSRSAVRARS